jgi:hypothetical protein
VKDLIERETPAPRIFRIRSSLPYENPITTSVLKPRPARRVDPGLGPVRVEAKTRSGVGLVKPGRSGGSTRNPGDQGKPGWDPACFFLYIYRDMERRRFCLFKGQKNEDKEQKCRADREKT